MTDIDVLVVGGGPSGLMAAIGAAMSGAQVTLVDEWPDTGGRLRYERTPVEVGGGSLAPDRIRVALAGEASRRGVHVITGTTAWGAFCDNQGLEVGLVSNGGSQTIRPSRLILATGTTDRAVIFPGATLPGVMTARALRILLHVHGVRPGRRFVVISNNPGALTTELMEAGGEVVLTVPAADVERLRVTGHGAVERVSLDGRDIEADIVVIMAGARPDAQLAWSLECESEAGLALWDRRPARDAKGQTSVSDVFVCGSAAGSGSIETALQDGLRIGAQADMEVGRVISIEALREAER